MANKGAFLFAGVLLAVCCAGIITLAVLLTQSRERSDELEERLERIEREREMGQLNKPEVHNALAWYRELNYFRVWVGNEEESLERTKTKVTERFMMNTITEVEFDARSAAVQIRLDTLVTLKGFARI